MIYIWKSATHAGCIPLTDDMGVFQFLESFTLVAEAARGDLSALRFQVRLVHSLHRHLLAGKRSLVHNPIRAPVQFMADLQFRRLVHQRNVIDQVPERHCYMRILDV